MDAKALGAFIAELRKENKMTQAELAKRLNVTDKAVSRWERGLGFPDISTLEPLADVLGISLVELIKCQRLAASEIQVREAESVVEASINIAEYQRKVHKRQILQAMVLWITGIASMCFAFYLYQKKAIALSIIGGADGPTSIFVAGKIGNTYPVIFGGVGVVLIALGIWRVAKNRRNQA